MAPEPVFVSQRRFPEGVRGKRHQHVSRKQTRSTAVSAAPAESQSPEPGAARSVVYGGGGGAPAAPSLHVGTRLPVCAARTFDSVRHCVRLETLFVGPGPNTSISIRQWKDEVAVVTEAPSGAAVAFGWLDEARRRVVDGRVVADDRVLAAVLDQDAVHAAGIGARSDGSIVLCAWRHVQDKSRAR